MIGSKDHKCDVTHSVFCGILRLLIVSLSIFCFYFCQPLVIARWLLNCYFLQLSTGSDDDDTSYIGLTVGLVLGVVVAVVLIIGEELFTAMQTFIYTAFEPYYAVDVWNFWLENKCFFLWWVKQEIELCILQMIDSLYLNLEVFYKVMLWWLHP